MQLRYRGSTYTLEHPFLATEPTNTVATYRGQSYYVRQLASQPTRQGILQQSLMFRGCRYRLST